MKNPIYYHIILMAFLVNLAGPLPAKAEAQLPNPGTRVGLSQPFTSQLLTGIKINSADPFKLEFLMSHGENKEEAKRLIKYFLASLTVPEKDLWVNLSPYEKDRIVPDAFGKTEMGRDLLAQDYMLKQITASLICPEDEIGKKFWKRVYEEAAKKFGSTNVPVSTFNKVWILPEKAVVYENSKAGTAYVVESKLKVMLEIDYLAMQKAAGPVAEPSHLSSRHPMKSSPEGASPSGALPLRANSLDSAPPAALALQIIREIVIPALTKEINEGKNFAQLRQVYNSLILATWYKKKIKDSILAQVYNDKNKVAGILSSPNDSIGDPEQIYQRYLQAFKKGAYNFIKEEYDSLTGKMVPRKYFSGGETFVGLGDAQQVLNDAAMAPAMRSSYLKRIALIMGKTIALSVR